MPRSSWAAGSKIFTARSSYSFEKLWKVPATSKSSEFMAPSADGVVSDTRSPGSRPSAFATPSPTSMPSGSPGFQSAARAYRHVRAEPRLLVRFDALTTTAASCAVAEEAGKVKAAHHLGHLRQRLHPSLDRRRILDEEFFRRLRTVIEKALPRDLNVPRLRMNHRFAELDEDVADESAAQYEAQHAERDRAERERTAQPVPEDVAEREPQQLCPACPDLAQRPRRSASTIDSRAPFEAGYKLAMKAVASASNKASAARSSLRSPWQRSPGHARGRGHRNPDRGNARRQRCAEKHTEPSAGEADEQPFDDELPQHVRAPCAERERSADFRRAFQHRHHERVRKSEHDDDGDDLA